MSNAMRKISTLVLRFLSTSIILLGVWCREHQAGKRQRRATLPWKSKLPAFSPTPDAKELGHGKGSTDSALCKLVGKRR